ncbi:Lrp/AsnC ligand binding domain-containing protein [Streptomyces sp. DSM 41524]|uniref:Lrp/AsnC ligand binding domain-containing protein n=1 Tax=Streptomyces asiaticus subsp. ignotus TaxID=3098222 RepID=A0ABU7Q8N5_9ACTN|nr:Lrp/AsnC ligand binding domain-containing protein [Streptomyces sp. DSM 41524]
MDLAPAQFGFHATAYLWLTVTPGDLDATGTALSLHPETTFTAAVTGAANLLVTVTCRDTEDLYTFITTKVGVLPAVRQVEVVPVLHRLKQAGTRVHNGRLVLD